MNKRKTLAGLVMGLALLMSGCVIKVTDNTGTATKDSSSMFVTVENINKYYCYVVYHKDTKVMYAVSDGHYNRGNLTLLVDADGKPLLWEE